MRVPPSSPEILIVIAHFRIEEDSNKAKMQFGVKEHPRVKKLRSFFTERKMSQGSATSSAKSFSPPFTVIAMHNNKTASAQNARVV